MDPLLPHWLNATDETDREQRLSELLPGQAAPLIRSVLHRKLGLYVNRQDSNPRQPEAEDLFQEILTKLLQRLSRLPAEPESLSIHSFRQFVSTAATNACHDYLRARSPQRTRFRNNLRDLLERHPDFALWRNHEGEMLCGFSAWQFREMAETSAQLRELRDDPERWQSACFPHTDIRQLPLTRLVAELLNRLRHPLSFNELTTLLLTLLDIRDPAATSLDDEENAEAETLVTRDLNREAQLTGEQTLREFWEEVRQLPDRQRLTLALSFASEQGDDLPGLLLAAGIVTLPELAATLAMSLPELMQLWPELPLDSTTVARHLGATREQVNKWRFRALQRLRERLKVKN